jgi:integrase
VKDTDLAALKAVFRWAVENGRMDANPAEGVTIRGIKRGRLRRGFTDREAAALLKAALKVPAGREQACTTAAKRWVPWVLAYTGARVGEIAQLRKQDVAREGKHWVITISEEAGTVKTGETRRVPVHPHLIELGFIDFVKAAPQGPLFLRVASGGSVLGPLQGLKNRLSDFARKVITAKDVAPTHGWRHRFKSVCREAHIDPETRDVIQGHAPRSVGERYGETSIEVLAKAIGKLPRYPTK